MPSVPGDPQLNTEKSDTSVRSYELQRTRRIV